DLHDGALRRGDTVAGAGGGRGVDPLQAVSGGAADRGDRERHRVAWPRTGVQSVSTFSNSVAPGIPFGARSPERIEKPPCSSRPRKQAVRPHDARQFRGRSSFVTQNMLHIWANGAPDQFVISMTRAPMARTRAGCVSEAGMATSVPKPQRMIAIVD